VGQRRDAIQFGQVAARRFASAPPVNRQRAGDYTSPQMLP